MILFIKIIYYAVKKLKIQKTGSFQLSLKDDYLNLFQAIYRLIMLINSSVTITRLFFLSLSFRLLLII
jgi:hypothetical protein